MTAAVESRIQELVAQYDYDAGILREFAAFVLSQPKQGRKKRKKALTVSELKSAVASSFGCDDVKSLKKHKAFKLATDGRDLDFRKKRIMADFIP